MVIEVKKYDMKWKKKAPKVVIAPNLKKDRVFIDKDGVKHKVKGKLNLKKVK